jgi:PAS domain S-box-containing protein
MSGILEWLCGAAIRREVERRLAGPSLEIDRLRTSVAQALRGANVYVFSQDLDLRYTDIIGPRGPDGTAALLGRTDEDVLPATERSAVLAAKRKVLATGIGTDCEVSYPLPEGWATFALHIEPQFGDDHAISGLTCYGADVTRIRTLEGEHRRLAEELKAALQRYQIALQGSHVTVFTQDRKLRYTTISNGMLGLSEEQILGLTDDDVLPAGSREPIIALKHRVMETGEPSDSEVSIKRDDGDICWFDLHVEPLRDITGEIMGLTCAAVDISKRKADEAHLRLLLRELTHRSKNLLAVIQAMARQTARHSGTIERFLEQFNARVHALAAAHDILVQESWRGASLEDLVRLQLGPPLESRSSQIFVSGPTVLLKPEAAQSLGLAVHELAANAHKFGSLSDANGKLTVTWTRLPQAKGEGVEFRWVESGGPAVVEPAHRGFGSIVIERHLGRALATDIHLAFRPEGVRCKFLVPPEQLLGTS